MFIKYFTSAQFEREKFADMLKEVGVDAIAVEDGIILAKTAFNAIPGGMLPVWAWLNKEDINSPFHTRSANQEEIDMVNNLFPFPTEADMEEMEFAYYNEQLYQERGY